ncbi:exosome complex RNA-binding protein Csl4 [Candidatus Micrarchaeota archaeon]|nr:exosome complex RNA-binding protein Csl4 [Candidatus Micrarchaeota archaeon]
MSHVVLPGEFVGASEEYAPKVGVYVSKDDLFSSRVGVLKLDPSDHSASVSALTRIPRPQREGTVTLGVVADVSESVAIIDLLPAFSKRFVYIPTGVTAVLHVSKVRTGFTKSLHDQVRVGDIVRVKIEESDAQTVRLSTVSRELGVVKAFCSRCRHGLAIEGTRLKCPGCGNSEPRKAAADYGSPKT